MNGMVDQTLRQESGTSLVERFVAAKEALDLDVGRTFVTVALGWLVFGIIMAAGSLLLKLFGLTTAGVWQMFGF